MDTSRKVITVEYAGFWIRLAAYIVDGIMLSLVMFIIVVVSGSYVESDSGGRSQPIIPVVAEAGTTSRAVIAVGIVLPIVYAVGFWTWRGQTPGKMLVGIKIVRTDGYPVGFAKSILRFLGYIVSTLVLLLGYLWIAFNPEKQGFHDKIASTYVVKLPRKTTRWVKIYD